jgi:hypothetical protein
MGRRRCRRSPAMARPITSINVRGPGSVRPGRWGVYHVCGVATQEGIAVAEKPEHLLGKVFYEMAIWRGVRGPYKVAAHVERETGGGPSGSAWAAIFSGATYRPRQEVVHAFAKTFRLSPEELQRLAYVFAFDEEPPEGVGVYPEYANLAARFGWTETAEEAPPSVVQGPDGDDAAAPSNWVGERVRALMEADERVQGTLRSVTEHGVVIDVGARRQQGPCFYSWKVVRWMYPVDRQTIN